MTENTEEKKPPGNLIDTLRKMGAIEIEINRIENPDIPEGFDGATIINDGRAFFSTVREPNEKVGGILMKGNSTRHSLMSFLVFEEGFIMTGYPFISGREMEDIWNKTDFKITKAKIVTRANICLMPLFSQEEIMGEFFYPGEVGGREFLLFEIPVLKKKEKR